MTIEGTTDNEINSYVKKTSMTEEGGFLLLMHAVGCSSWSRPIVEGKRVALIGFGWGGSDKAKAPQGRQVYVEPQPGRLLRIP
jgi:hypothetical protein